MTNGNDDGSLQPQGRFQRIEESLLRIENKLDVKADRDDVEQIEFRVRALEIVNAAAVGSDATKKNTTRIIFLAGGLGVALAGLVVNTIVVVSHLR